MKFWCISDTHGYHDQLIVPDNIDGIIHAGDMANERARHINHKEVFDFLEWFKHLKPEIKILVAGNHDTSLEFGSNWGDKNFEKSHGIIYLEHETVVVNDLKIFGSPYTPTFGSGWAFNKGRGKLHDYWGAIEPGTDIVITHGPPKGILDLSYNIEKKLEYCGDEALRKAVRKIAPKYHIFGHIHNYNLEECQNQGTRTLNGTTYVNASCVTDGMFGKVTSNGVIIEI